MKETLRDESMDLKVSNSKVSRLMGGPTSRVRSSIGLNYSASGGSGSIRKFHKKGKTYISGQSF
jgi:hypothetical protein